MAGERQISISISATAFVDALARTPVAGQVLALGNPDLDDPAHTLPAAETEVNQILTTFPQAQVYVQKEATRDRFIVSAPHGEIVHVAAHALLDRTDPIFSALYLAGPTPLQRRLEAQDIYELPLKSVDLVVLSACETGMGQVANGDEFYGLTSAFLGAGAGAVVATLWPINDESTSQLMARFYANLPSRGVAAALQQAQLAMIASKEYADPFDWAAFELVGNARPNWTPRVAASPVHYGDTVRQHSASRSTRKRASRVAG
jgi:CHAT domain-containing protein